MFRPLGNRVIVKLDKAPTMTKGGLHLPEKAQEKPAMGTVLTVGPGSRMQNSQDRYEMEVAEGDKVMFNAWAGIPVPEHDDMRVLAEEELICVIEDE